jgi:ribosome-associated protein
MTEKFELKGDFIELFKLLKLLGWCESGGMAKQAVAEGLVKVNGQVETRKACKIRLGQKVEFEGKTLVVE